MKPKQKKNVPLTQESYLNKLTSMAYELAEEQLQAGTISSQNLNTFLKAGTIREQLELEKIRRENILLEEKASAASQAAEIKELYEAAISAMRSYQPFRPNEEE